MSRTASSRVPMPPADRPVAFARYCDPLGRATAQHDGEDPVAVALRRVPARIVGRSPAIGDPRAVTIHGKEAQDVSGLLRSRDCRAIGESRPGGLGAGSDLFHQGVAKETDDPEVVAATMSKP